MLLSPARARRVRKPVARSLQQGHQELNRRTRETTRQLLSGGDRVIIYRQQYFGFFTLLEHTELTLSLEGKPAVRCWPKPAVSAKKPPPPDRPAQPPAPRLAAPPAIGSPRLRLNRSGIPVPICLLHVHSVR